MNGRKAEAFGAPEISITSEVLERVYGIEMDIISVWDRYGKKHTLCMPVGGRNAEKRPDTIPCPAANITL